MDDSLLFDIYEDLSADKWAKSELVERDSSIDLFTEALAIDAINKVVENQLLELRKENEKLRQENTELIESKKQLSKNISSLFLTARREILEKEQKIAKLMLERQQENCEPCRETTVKSVETLRRAQKLESKQPEDKHISSVRKIPIAYPNEKTPQSESRDKFMIDQLSSHLSCQDVSSRKRRRSAECVDQSVHNSRDSSANSEIQHTCHDKFKSHYISASMGRCVNESKQDNYHTSNKNIHKLSSSSDDRRPYESTIDKTISRKEYKSVTPKNKILKIAEVEPQSNVKFRKIKTHQTGVISSTQIGASDDGNRKHTDIETCNDDANRKHTDIETCNGLSILNSKSKTVHILPESSAHSSSKLSVKPDTASRSTKLKCLLEPGKEVSKTYGSLNHNISEKSTFVASNTTETCESHPIENSVHDTKMNDHVQVFNLPDTNRSRSYMKSAKHCGDIELATAYKSDTGHASSNGQIKKENNLEQDSSSLPYKCPYKITTVKMAETNGEIVTNMKHVSHSSRSSSGITKGDKQTLFNGKDTKRHARHKSSREFKKLHCLSSTFNDSDKNNSGSSFCQEKPHPNNEIVYRTENCEASSVDNNVNSVQHVTYITCTSNLILLGDEEATSTTMASPNKFQPSEFYPPGVRGDVREGGSHVRHIRGLTEVITKVPTNMNYSFQNEQDKASNTYNTAIDEAVQLKTLRIANLTNTPSMRKSHNISSCQKTSHKSQKMPHKSQKIHQFEGHEILSPEEPSEVRPDSSDNLSHCGTQKRDWVSTVNELFGDVFKKDLHSWKHESEYPTKPKVGGIKSSRSAHNFMSTNTVCQKSV